MKEGIEMEFVMYANAYTMHACTMRFCYGSALVVRLYFFSASPAGDLRHKGKGAGCQSTWRRA